MEMEWINVVSIMVALNTGHLTDWQSLSQMVSVSHCRPWDDDDNDDDDNQNDDGGEPDRSGCSLRGFAAAQLCAVDNLFDPWTDEG